MGHRAEAEPSADLTPGPGERRPDPHSSHAGRCGLARLTHLPALMSGVKYPQWLLCLSSFLEMDDIYKAGCARLWFSAAQKGSVEHLGSTSTHLAHLCTEQACVQAGVDHWPLRKGKGWADQALFASKRPSLCPARHRLRGQMAVQC